MKMKKIISGLKKWRKKYWEVKSNYERTRNALYHALADITKLKQVAADPKNQTKEFRVEGNDNPVQLMTVYLMDLRDDGMIEFLKNGKVGEHWIHERNLQQKFVRTY